MNLDKLSITQYLGEFEGGIICIVSFEYMETWWEATYWFHPNGEEIFNPEPRLEIVRGLFETWEEKDDIINKLRDIRTEEAPHTFEPWAIKE